ncbi:uncharacterized protein LOC141631267 [Silene latifolia]|uniref:uncharacterized protein LOC141631267 n=1 Tax=Silene latifolia TaxID=37657 RepID=UPI003D76BD49
MEQLKQKIARAEAEVMKLKETESSLKQRLGDKASAIEESNPESYADSPFVDEIAKIDLPKKFVVPSMRIYDGTTDPQNHAAYYKQRMLSTSIPSELRQVCMCKGCGTTLTEPALQWYINLPNGSIKSFAYLINSFNHQFASSRELEKRSSDLYRIKQKPAVEAFRQGLPLDIDFYDELTMKPCLTFEDVQAKAIVYIRLEEDKIFKADTTNNNSGYDKSKRKRLIERFDNIGNIVKWPKKTNNPNSRKDTIRWCEFPIGHTTEECLGLRRQVAYLLKKGNMTDLIPSKNMEDNGTTNDQERPQRDLPPAPPIYEVKFINEGSEICITFDDTAIQGISDIHHDGLVITMQIGPARVLRILVDGGSSVNLIMLDVLKAMKIDENQIIKKSNVLVGFSGETKNTLGEIYLPTSVEGVSSYERFGVLDCLSSYNAILGRPWIHNVRAIPSTYHQCVKIPTEWGIETIKGEQKSVQECYTESLKLFKADKSLA